MKLILVLIVCSAGAVVRAQSVPPAAPAPPGAPPVRVRPPTAAPPVEEEVQRIVENAKAMATRAASMADAALDQQNAYRTYTAGSGSSRGSRTLVIHSTETDPAATSSTEEDLAIMARILDKAVRSSPEEGRHSVLGINVDGAVFGSSSGARNIYVENYGALFLLGVKYPLIAPPEKPQEPRPKDTSSDDWKKARDEIQGAVRGGTDLQLDAWASGTSRGPAEEFDADRVEKLKTALLESLRNATHIRALKPGDYITVVVQGAESARIDVVKDLKPARTAKEKEGGRAVNATGYVRKSSGQGQTVMTIRVKKSDADAFAQGGLTADEFRNKAAIQTYFRKSDAGTGANYFMQTVR